MSEKENFNFDDAFEQLDKSLTDPVLEETINLAKYWQQRFESEEHTGLDTGRVVSMLDEHWMPFYSQKMLISGEIIVQKGEEATKIPVTELEAISNGFSVLPVIRDRSGMSVTGTEFPLLRHHFFVKTSDIFKDDLGNDEDEDEDKHQYIPVFAHLDLFIEPQCMSFDRAEAWLETTFPELKDELDVILENSYGNEVAILEGLKYLTLPARFDGNDIVSRASVEAYIEAKIQFDERLPYLLQIQRRLATEDGTVSQLKEPVIRQAIVHPQKVAMAPYDLDDPDGPWSFGLIVASHSNESMEDPKLVSVKLLFIHSMQRMRNIFPCTL